MNLTRYVYIVCAILLIISTTISYGGEAKEKGQPNKITANEVSDEELKMFARAFESVQAVLEGEEAMEESGGAVYEKTTAIVKQEGLTIERYNQLSELMNEDPDFKKAVEKMVKTIKEEGKE